MKRVFGVVAATVSCVYGMDQQVAYSKARDFFEGVEWHNKSIPPWSNGNNGKLPLRLDFGGRTRFINSVRGSNEHINNFSIEVPVVAEYKVVKSFELKNNNRNKRTQHYSTTYVFSARGEWKPYVYRKETEGRDAKNGILDNFIPINPSHLPLYSRYINQFATNVLKILKSGTPTLLSEGPHGSRPANQYALNSAIEVAAMILTTERARDEYSLLISYIEFYKLKHTADANHQQSMLLNMFYPNIEDVDGRDPSLRFPKVQNQNNWRQSKGGAELIQNTNADYLYDEFIDMFKFSPYYGKVRQLPEFIRGALKDEFYEGKLEKLKAISENRLPQKSKFKKLVDACDEFYKAKMRKIINRWKNLIQQTEEISEPELTPEMDQGSTLTDPYADVFDEYDENPLNPTMPGHHDFLFRPGYEG